MKHNIETEWVEDGQLLHLEAEAEIDPVDGSMSDFTVYLWAEDGTPLPMSAYIEEKAAEALLAALDTRGDYYE